MRGRRAAEERHAARRRPGRRTLPVVRRRRGGAAASRSSSLDDGLAIISQHAAGARLRRGHPVPRRADPLAREPRGRPRFVASEGRSSRSSSRRSTPDRPIPLVSFVARQRDLRELVGDNVRRRRCRLQFADVPQVLGGAVPHDHARGPQPAGDRREAGPAPGSTEAARQKLDEAFDETHRCARR